MAQYTEWIDQYRSGRLSNEEAKLFEKELSVNDDLYEEYRLNQIIDDVLKTENEIMEIENEPGYKETDRLAEKMVESYFAQQEAEEKKRWAEEDALLQGKSKKVPDKEEQSLVRRQKPPVRRIRRRHIWIAAAASIFVPLLIFFITNRPPSPDKLFKLYYAELTSEEFLDQDMPDDVYQHILSGIERFEANDYTSALSTFAALDPWREQYPQISLFKGLVRMEIGDYTLAIDDFDECAKQESRWRKYAHKFRGICYLQMGNPKVAAFYLLEKTGLSENLPPSAQNLINSINLITTGRWGEFREKINPGARGPIVLHKDDIIAIIVLAILSFLTVLAILDLILIRPKWGEWLIFIGMFAFMPGVAPLTYLFFLRKNVIYYSEEHRRKKKQMTKIKTCPP